MCTSELCCKRKNCSRAYRLTEENARSILDLMGYSERVIEADNGSDGAFARISAGGIEFGNRYGYDCALFGDYIIDFDGSNPWSIYSPEEYRKLFYTIEET